jgi:hypothetical protein
MQLIISKVQWWSWVEMMDMNVDEHFILILSNVSKWVNEHEQEGILRNIPCHIMEYSKKNLPFGI